MNRSVLTQNELYNYAYQFQQLCHSLKVFSGYVEQIQQLLTLAE